VFGNERVWYSILARRIILQQMSMGRALMLYTLMPFFVLVPTGTSHIRHSYISITHSYKFESASHIFGRILVANVRMEGSIFVGGTGPKFRIAQVDSVTITTSPIARIPMKS